VTVHDLIPVVRWGGSIKGISRGRKPWLNLISFRSLHRAAHLIAASESTRDDLIRLCHCAPDRISVIPLGVDSIFRPYSLAERSRAMQLLRLVDKGAKRIMVIGTQFYKNLPGALRAVSRLRELCDHPIEIIKVGRMNALEMQLVRQMGLDGAVLNLSNVPRERLPDLYNLVDCLLFPSFYEGFGWPPLEAMACGTPVVASNAGSIPEVVGNSGILHEPDDIEGFAHAMCDLLTLPALREDIVCRGLLRAKHFTWRETARKTLEVYERIA
jgi:glycosyltransferase involved in cell wall biosynthesis